MANLNTAVSATINYVKPFGDLVYDQTHLGPGSQELVENLDKRAVPIYDARQLEHEATLDTNGFALVPAQFDFDDYFDDAKVEMQLYPLVLDFLTAQTGASYGLLFDHTVRSTQGSADSTMRRAPVKTVHNDYTEYSGHERVRIELEKVGQLGRVNQRFVFVNLWMPIFHPVEELPLAVGDGRTFDPDDFHKLKLIYRDREGEIAGISHNPAHRWYYAPQMAPGEALLLKVFDSDTSQLVRWAPHSAFVDPTSPTNARARTSIEIRSILFFERS